MAAAAARRLRRDGASAAIGRPAATSPAARSRPAARPASAPATDDIGRPRARPTRPAAPTPGPLDDRFYDLVEAASGGSSRPPDRRDVPRHPRPRTTAWPTARRDGVLQELDRRPGAPGRRSRRSTRPACRRRSASSASSSSTTSAARSSTPRSSAIWERRSTAHGRRRRRALPAVRPRLRAAPERLASIAGRLEAVPALPRQSTGPGPSCPQVRALAASSSSSRRETCPASSTRSSPPAPGVAAGRPTSAGSSAPSSGAKAAVEDYATWLRGTLRRRRRRLGARARALRRARRAAGLRRPRRRRDPRDRLAAAGRDKAARRRGRPRDRPGASTRPTVVDRVKSDHPATFEEALDGYRDAMVRARALPHRARHRDRPRRTSGSRSSPTPEYLRNVMPVRGLLRAAASSTRTRRASTSSRRRSTTTRARCASTTAARSATPASTRRTRATTSSCRSPAATRRSTRLLTDAPEFVEGWGMYCEQMMREQGFDDGPDFRLSMHTDAIWRACRIILDVRMHRGEIGGRRGRPRSWSSRPASSAPTPRPRSTATPTRPTYQLSLPAGQGPPAPAAGRRAAPPGRRLQPRATSTTRCCATAACRSASTAGCCAGEGGGRRGRRRRPAGRLTACRSSRRSTSRAGRSRIVFWPGAVDRRSARRPTGPERIAERFVGAGRAAHPPRRLRRRPGRRSRSTSRPSAQVAARVAVPLQLAGGHRGRRPRSGWRSPPARPASSCRWPSPTSPTLLRGCLAVAGDWLAVGLDPRPERLAAFPWQRAAPPTLDGAGRRAGRTAASGGSCCPTAAPGRTWPRSAAWRGPSTPRSSSPAASATWTAIRRLRDAGVAASSSARRSCPGRSTSPPPWRPPHDPLVPSRDVRLSAAARSRPAASRLLGARPRRAQSGLPRSASAAHGAPAAQAAPGRRRRSPAGPRASTRGTAARPPAAAPPADDRGRSRSTTPKGTIVIKVDGAWRRSRPATSSRSPQCGYYDGVVFHRLVPGFVIQGGDGQYGRPGAASPTRKVGRAARLHDPGRPVTTPYTRGTVAMARTGARTRPGLAVLHRPRRLGGDGRCRQPTPTRSSARHVRHGRRRHDRRRCPTRGDPEQPVGRSEPGRPDDRQPSTDHRPSARSPVARHQPDRRSR